MPNVTVICGGVGAARFLRGLVQVVDPADITAIVNVGDDLERHGLAISPDIDTVIYTVAGAIDPERGWGLADETWNAMASLRRFGEPPWFNLGDRDIGTHLYRTQRLDEGASLAEVTAEIAAAWGLGFSVLPATNDPIRTRVTLPDEDGISVSFQEYFVKRQHSVRVSKVDFVGSSGALPAPGVLEAIGGTDVIVVAPSNPLVSIAPVLAVPRVRAAIEARRDQVVAVSPIVAGAALKGPADRLMVELGHEASVVGIARLYCPFAGTLVIDEADAELAPQVEAEGMHCVVTPTVMKTPELAADLARTAVHSITAQGPA